MNFAVPSEGRRQRHELNLRVSPTRPAFPQGLRWDRRGASKLSLLCLAVLSQRLGHVRLIRRLPCAALLAARCSCWKVTPTKRKEVKSEYEEHERADERSHCGGGAHPLRWWSQQW